MKERTLLLLALLLLLAVSGSAVAQTSGNFVVQRFVITGGGSASSASYSVTTAIGQPATDEVESANYKVSGGFLYPRGQSEYHLWLPRIER